MPPLPMPASAHVDIHAGLVALYYNCSADHPSVSYLPGSRSIDLGYSLGLHVKVRKCLILLLTVRPKSVFLPISAENNMMNDAAAGRLRHVNHLASLWQRVTSSYHSVT